MVAAAGVAAVAACGEGQPGSAPAGPAPTGTDALPALRRQASQLVPHTHFADPGGGVARVFRGGRAFPATAFYAASGKLELTHVGAATKAELDQDIRRYALDG